MRNRQCIESELGKFALNSNQARPHVTFLVNDQCKYMNNKWIMAVICVRRNETEAKKYHHDVVITVVFDSVYCHLYFVAKTTQAEVKGSSM